MQSGSLSSSLTLKMEQLLWTPGGQKFSTRNSQMDSPAILQSPEAILQHPAGAPISTTRQQWRDAFHWVTVVRKMQQNSAQVWPQKLWLHCCLARWTVMCPASDYMSQHLLEAAKSAQRRPTIVLRKRQNVTIDSTFVINGIWASKTGRSFQLRGTHFCNLNIWVRWQWRRISSMSVTSGLRIWFTRA